MKAVIEPLLEAVNEEVIYQNPLLFLKIWEINSQSECYNVQDPWPWHYHKQVEFLVILEGKLGIQTKHDYVVLASGDVMMLGASQLHRTNKPFEGTLQYIVFQIDLTKHFDQSTIRYLHCFSELTQPLEDLNYIFRQNELAKQETHAIIMNVLVESQSKKIGYEIAIISSIKRLILLLIRSDTRNLLNIMEETELIRLSPALNYVELRLGDKITVNDASALLNLSYHYFMKFFKKNMGMSFIEYINYKRIKKAEILLLTCDLSIMEVGYEVGIANMAQFYKLFKRYNQCSPKEFKHRMRNESMIVG
ncbi:MAG: AraC family transcriptional regulator [Bacilli bacterium]|nr:AraC family transcriptional regulator [Bacilli bacterium]